MHKDELPHNVDLADVQRIVSGISKDYRAARFIPLTFSDGAEMRACLRQLGPLAKASDRQDNSETLFNVAFSFAGLGLLSSANTVLADNLASFAEPFREGMKVRASLLGDVGASAPEVWDPPWQGSVSALAMFWGHDDDRLKRHLQGFPRYRRSARKVERGQRIFRNGDLIEHFGFNDEVTSTAVSGVTSPKKVTGNGAYADRKWTALAPGEFLLGHVDEAGEIPIAPTPARIAYDGTYLVFRKLSQDVRAFWDYATTIGGRYDVEPVEVAEEMVGRRLNGDSLGEPDKNDFTFEDDADGSTCSLGSHIRRANPRATMGFGTTLVDRHRILRRSFPYGSTYDENPDEDRGLYFIALNASIKRQFEFIQQQWINFGNDLDQGNDRDPIIGSNGNGDRMIIPRKDKPPIVCADLPNFVHTRGGEYFFLPGIRAYEAILSED